MKVSRKNKKFIIILLVPCLLVIAEYSVYAFDPVLPQERLNDKVQIGTITPTQFEELDKATIKTMLERSDVQSLLRNNFELLGLYGETSAGLILKNAEDWNRFGERLALSGTTLQKVYDFWYREKIRNQPELLTGDPEQMEAFFEKYFSSTEENRLADGRVMGTDVSWATFAYEQGLPMAAGILLVLYQTWWRKRKENESSEEEESELDILYKEKFKTNNDSYTSFYGAVRSDSRVYVFSDWYPKAWEFWQKAKARLKNENLFEKKVKEIVSQVQNYVSSRQTKQKMEFEATFQRVLSELSQEEIWDLSQGKFTAKDLPEFLEKEVVEVVVIEETDYLKKEWKQFSNELLTEKNVTDFFEKQLPTIEGRLRNHPERMQEILTTVQKDWNAKFEGERQAEIKKITGEADALYNDLIRYATYNYQYQNIAKTRSSFYAQKVKELDQILAPQKKVLTTVFAKYTDSFRKKKEMLDETVRQITYRKELVEDIDYITPLSELFPYEVPPPSPSQETIKAEAQEFYELYKPVYEKEEEINYLNAALVSAKLVFDATIGVQKKECDKLIAAIQSKIINGKDALLELEKKMDPTKSFVLAHAEVYAKEIDHIFNKQLLKLSAEHQKMMAEIRASWAPYLRDPNYRTRTQAQHNMDASLAYYQKRYDETRKKIQDYRTGSAFKKIACTKKIKAEERKNFNDKQKQNRINYAQKRKEDPARKRVIQYLMELEESGPKSNFFAVQQATILHMDTIQDEILSLKEKLAQPSPYDAEIQHVEEKMATPIAYSFEEYKARNGIYNSNWVVRDDWIRSKRRIGRSGDYWGQKYARYAQYIMRDFMPYDKKIVATLRGVAQKAQQERLNSYNGWQNFYREHPLRHAENMKVLGARLGNLQREDEEYKKLIFEQIETFEKEIKTQTNSLFSSAQWLNKTGEGRQKDTLTNTIVEAEINASLGENRTAVDPTELITYFANVRESQLIIQQNNLAASIQIAKNPLTFDESVMVAPIVAHMHFSETPAGITQKTEYFDGITKGIADGSVSIKNPVTYKRNRNGTYTAVYRDTGVVVGSEYAGITQTTIRTDSSGVTITKHTATILDQVKASLASQKIEEVSATPEVETPPVPVPVGETVEEIAETPEIIAEAEAILAAKRLEMVNIGSELPQITTMKITNNPHKLYEIEGDILTVNSLAASQSSFWDNVKLEIGNDLNMVFDFSEGFQDSLSENLSLGLTGLFHEAPETQAERVGNTIGDILSATIGLGELLLGGSMIGGGTVGGFAFAPVTGGASVVGGTVVAIEGATVAAHGTGTLMYSMKSLSKGRSGSGGSKNSQKITDKNKIQDNIMNKDLRGVKINDKIEIPKNWDRKLTTGDGYIYVDKLNDGNNIRVMRAGNNSSFTNYEQPYFRIQKNKNFLDINGNISTDLENNHIIINSIEL